MTDTRWSTKPRRFSFALYRKSSLTPDLDSSNWEAERDNPSEEFVHTTQTPLPSLYVLLPSGGTLILSRKDLLLLVICTFKIVDPNKKGINEIDGTIILGKM